MKALIILISIMLTACAATPTDQESMFNNKPYKAADGKKWTVNQLKDDFYKRTGKQLEGASTHDCGWDGECYYNRWATAYDNGIKSNIAERNKKINDENERCSKSPDCVRGKELSRAMNNLSNQYRFIVYSHPYEQADYDGAVRILCEKATETQRRGVSKKDMSDALRDAPGVSPGDREQFRVLAVSCWEISSMKGNWKEALRQVY